jgi:epoxyqueuosine reductase QueG
VNSIAGLGRNQNNVAELDLDKLFVREYVERCIRLNEVKQKTGYRKPVIGFSDVNDPLFRKLKEVVVPTHYLPKDLLKDAKTVISIFLPFSEEIIRSNYVGLDASREWAIAYTETNELLDNICDSLADHLKAEGFNSLGIKTTHHLTHSKKERYDHEELFSNWSQRHVAFISGIGKFGLNNLIITIRGCAGRIGSVLTSAKIKPRKREKDEFCLVKRGKDCYECIENCPVKVLCRDGRFDRDGCMTYLVKQRRNQETVYGFEEGTQTCGKCSVNIPCQDRIPV